MDFNHKFDKILQDIQEIEHYAVDFRNARYIPKIEMDIMMEKVRNLYDELLGIDRNYPYQEASENQDVPFEYTKEEKKETPYRKQSKPPESQPQSAPDPAPEKKKKPEDSEVQNKAQTPQEVSKPEREKQKETPARKKTNVTPEKENGKRIQYEDQSIEESKTVNQPKTEQNDIPEILADKFYNTKTSMHDSISKNQPHNDLSSRMQSKPIQDLNKAIGLNDRFLFIRELFNGDKEAYYEAIQIINEMPGYEEAEEYIHQRFSWDQEQPEVVRFMELVRRRFIPKE